MVPMRPPALAEQARRLVPRLDRHVGNKAFLLPAREIFAHDRLDLALASEVVVRHAGEKRLLATGSEAILCDPLDAVESLLKNVVGAGDEIRLLPKPQPIVVDARLVAIVAADRLDLDA